MRKIALSVSPSVMSLRRTQMITNSNGRNQLTRTSVLAQLPHENDQWIGLFWLFMMLPPLRPHKSVGEEFRSTNNHNL